MARSAPDVTRLLFSPVVVPAHHASPVRFEATVTENPATVAFEYGGTDRPMFDDGTHGDRIAGDNTWTIEFSPAEVVGLVSTRHPHRPFLGYCKPAGSGRYNVFAEIWTPEIGLVAIAPVAAGVQQSDHLVNMVATLSELTSFSASMHARRFFALYPDQYDILNFVLVPGRRTNRYHSNVRNGVSGIGMPLFNHTASFGSAGRLKGYNVFPLSNLFDGGALGFIHETGHQWVNFLSDPVLPLSTGVPHWPKGSLACNVMGFSMSGGQGGHFPYAFTPDGQGNYRASQVTMLQQSTFNTMELYLMGLVPATEVGPFVVLSDPNMSITDGQIVPGTAFITGTIDDVISVYGARNPGWTTAQKRFRCATILLSEELLDDHSMAFFDWQARRAGAIEPAWTEAGFSYGLSNPFFAATGGRAEMIARISELSPSFNATPAPRRCEAGQPATFTAGATGTQPLRYQWALDGEPIPGATAETYTVPCVQPFHGGRYTVTVSNSVDIITSGGMDLIVAAPTPSPSRLLNLSTRALCLTGNDIIIPGFVVSGSGTKRLLIRALGPELGALGVASLPDPTIVLKRWDGSTYVEQLRNDNWGDNTNAADIVTVGNSVYAYPLATGSLSAALLVDCPPGQYTVVTSDTADRTGISTVELYDADSPSSGTRLINISNRGYVGAGNDVMIPGFVVSEEGPKTFLIRAVGPTLANYGVTGVLADPQLRIYRRFVGSGVDESILTNDNWGENGDAATTAAVAAQVYAQPLPSGSKDAAFVVTLTPAIYTVHATGVGGTAGVALVEVYVVE